MSRAGRRSYDDACGIARALDLVGERWALLVVRELLLGPKRFTDLREALAGISPNVLTQRLGELEEGGVVRRRRLPPPAPATVYELTGYGRRLEVVLLELGRWGAQSPAVPGPNMSADSLMLSFRTMFAATLAKGWRATVELRLDGAPYVARVAGARLHVARGGADQPDAVIEAAPAAVAAVVYLGRPLAEAIGAGDVRQDGDRAAAERFLSLFRLPAGG